MNKQELIEKYQQFDNALYDIGAKVACQHFLKDLEQLDEPEKVKVPQFVADWIEEKRDMGWKLTKMVLQANLNEQYWRWVVDNQETFARAWLDGYEVEKEKCYRISMPKARNYMNHAQFLCEKDGKIFWCGEWHPFRTKFTRKELEEAGFGWVFDCEGVEVEEVKDE